MALLCSVSEEWQLCEGGGQENSHVIVRTEEEVVALNGRLESHVCVFVVLANQRRLAVER